MRRVILSKSETSEADLLLGLPHGDFVAEQAAFELYARTGRPIPASPEALCIGLDEWRYWIPSQRAP
jgi:hypothetical protein